MNVTPDHVFTPIRELGENIRTGKTSPVDLAETFLDRLERLGPRYNSVVTVTRERALEQARKAEREIERGNYRGPLHGLGRRPLPQPDLRPRRHRHPEAGGGRGHPSR
jgi:aspartyl-tRNA(Asn)/glutamyl-tRNA(Gln) amidotransferase subunit A